MSEGWREVRRSLDQSLKSLQYCAGFLLFVSPGPSSPLSPLFLEGHQWVPLPFSFWLDFAVQSSGRKLEEERRVMSKYLLCWLIP